MKAKSESEVAQSCPTLCDPTDGSPPGSPSMGFSRQECWSGVPLPSPSTGGLSTKDYGAPLPSLILAKIFPCEFPKKKMTYSYITTVQ